MERKEQGKVQYEKEKRKSLMNGKDEKKWSKQKERKGKMKIK